MRRAATFLGGLLDNFQEEKTKNTKQQKKWRKNEKKKEKGQTRAAIRLCKRLCRLSFLNGQKGERIGIRCRIGQGKWRKLSRLSARVCDIKKQNKKQT